MIEDLTELLEIADSAIDLVVPRLVEARHESDFGIGTKSSTTDMVTEFDRWSERTIIDSISAARPGDGFLGEEGAERASSTGVTWIIDPIDGTTNFIYDLPGFSVSIAARVDDVDVAGAVHDVIRGERFRASIGHGATLDGQPIVASEKCDLGSALVATGFSYESERRRAQAQVLVDVLPNVRDIRRFGGAAVDLCALACGRVDAYYERGLSVWDHAAGGLIASEAGAAIDNRQPQGGAYVGAAPGIAADFGALVDRAGAHSA